MTVVPRLGIEPGNSGFVLQVKKETTEDLKCLRNDVQRIEDETSSGLISVKNSVRLFSNEFM